MDPHSLQKNSMASARSQGAYVTRRDCWRANRADRCQTVLQTRGPLCCPALHGSLTMWKSLSKEQQMQKLIGNGLCDKGQQTIYQLKPHSTSCEWRAPRYEFVVRASQGARAPYPCLQGYWFWVKKVKEQSKKMIDVNYRALYAKIEKSLTDYLALRLVQETTRFFTVIA